MFHLVQHALANLVALDTSIGLPILAETVILSRLVVITARGGACTPRGASCLSTLCTSLMRVNLPLGEFCRQSANGPL